MINEERIVKLVSDKGTTSIETFNKAKDVFSQLKKVLQALENELKTKMNGLDARITIEFDDKGRLEVHLKVANDVLVFIMHTAIFTLDSNHLQSRISYVKDDPMRAFCGIISVYNFLSDSVKYNRMNDTGTLIARLFVNKENHFFVEGKKQTGIRFNDFANDTIDETKLEDFVEMVLIQALENDVNVPPFDLFQVATLQQLYDNGAQAGFSGGKHFGFQLPGAKYEE